MSPSTFTAGPRGRRVLLELAMLLDEELRQSIHHRAFAIEHERGDSGWLFGWENGEARSGPEYEQEHAASAPTPAELAARIAALELPEGGPDEAAFARAMIESVADARYWQAPAGIDVLTGTRELRPQMRRLAAWAAPATPAHWSAEPGGEQFAVSWRGAEFATTNAALWKAATLAEVERAKAERPQDVTANLSGTWWSFPDGLGTTPAHAGVPLGLNWTEDASGRDAAATASVDAGGARILKIENTSAWNTLCWDQPLEVTAARRHDWYRVTGVDTRWVLPDWAQLARKFDAVHLSVGAYLAGANHLLTVDTGIHTMIAGWGPGELRWLNAPEVGEATKWTLANDTFTWQVAESPGLGLEGD